MTVTSNQQKEDQDSREGTTTDRHLGILVVGTFGRCERPKTKTIFHLYEAVQVFNLSHSFCE
jgi:hypothetical protein